MIRSLSLCGLLLLISFPMHVTAQILRGDSNFPVLNEIRWETTASEIQSKCKDRWKALGSTDSTMIYGSSFFDVAARIKIQIDANSKSLRMIDIAFDNPTSVIRDTLVNHFTVASGKAPFITTKEKSLIIFTIKMEMAFWKIGTETVSLMTATRGSSVIGLNVILSQTHIVQKENP